MGCNDYISKTRKEGEKRGKHTHRGTHNMQADKVVPEYLTNRHNYHTEFFTFLLFRKNISVKSVVLFVLS